MEVKFLSGTFLAMMVNFLILILVLSRLLYRPIQKILEERRQKITQDLNDAQKAKENSERLHREAKIVLEESHVEAYEIVERARSEAERLHNEIITQARHEADQLRQRTYNELERAKKIARDQLKEEAVNIALLALKKVITDKMSTEFNENMIRDAIAEIGKGDEQHGLSGSA